MITPFSPRFLKQEAKKLKKSHNLIMARALDEVSYKYGFSNYRHYLNVYESNLKQSKITKEVLLEKISLEKNISKKMGLAISFIQSVKLPFRDLLEILKQFQHLEEDVQAVCEKINLMKNEIQSFLFEDFLTGEGEYEINFRVPHSKAKQISISDLTYEINDNMLIVEGNYLLKANFEFAINDNDPISKDGLHKDFEYEGSFGVEIDLNKDITITHSDMSMYDRSTPMNGFTKEETEEYYTHVPDERGLFDDVLVMDDSE